MSKFMKYPNLFKKHSVFDLISLTLRGQNDNLMLNDILMI